MQKRLWTGAVVVGCSWIMFGCSSSAADVVGPIAEATGETSAPLVGGVTNPGDPAVGMIRSYYRGPGGEFSAGCTATLISDRVLLTASHCIEPDASNGSPKEIKVFFGTEANTAPESAWLPARAWHTHPNYPRPFMNEGYDCAIVELQNSVAGVTPFPWSSAAVTRTAVGGSVRIVGYGDTNGTAHTGSGTKRQITTTIKDVRDGIIDIGEAGNTSCQGDSGGPLLRRNASGAEEVIGVSSYGSIGCANTGSYARTELCAAFIQSYVAGTGSSSSSSSSSGGDPICGEQESNDTQASANQLCADSTQRGTLGATDTDVFTFNVAPNRVYDINLNGAPAGVNITLEKGAVGSTYVVATGESNRIWRSTATGGTYFLTVAHQTGTATGTYNLSVDVTSL